MTSNFKIHNASSGNDYYKSLYSGLDKELYVDSILVGNLFRYNLKFQNYYLDKPVTKIKKTSFIPKKIYSKINVGYHNKK